VVGGLEISNLEAQVLIAEVVLRTEGHREGDPTHGVGRLARDDAEEGLIARCQPLEVEVHLLQGLDEDDIEPTTTVDKGLRKQPPLTIGSTTRG
jgi:hypothetical protein